MINVLENKEIFKELCIKSIKKEGIQELLDYLENQTDFFTAPASSRFHLACCGGLCQHSLNVYNRLLQECQNEYGNDVAEENLESITIVSLLHDICKADYYKADTRNVKENGVWKQVPYYSVDDKYPFGHSEKSIALIVQYMPLTLEEMAAINSHMGFSDVRVKGGDYSCVNSWDKYPLGLLLHIADLKATKLDEK